MGGATIAPEQSCTIDVAFAPSTGLWEVATLSLFDNAGYAPQTVALSGGGQLISISPGLCQIRFPSNCHYHRNGLCRWSNNQLAGSDNATVDRNCDAADDFAELNYGFDELYGCERDMADGSSKPRPGEDVAQQDEQFVHVPNAREPAPTPSLLDDYPFKNAPVDALDPYDLAFDECTSYVAWRINRDNGTTDPNNPSFFKKMAGGNWGNASNWERTQAFYIMAPIPSPKSVILPNGPK